MADAVQTAVSEVYPGDIVTRWVVLAESIDRDGERAMIMVAQQDMRSWDTLGMLHHAIRREEVASHWNDEESE